MALDFDYVQAETLFGAVEQYTACAGRGLRPIYYGGGTEIITFGRIGRVRTDTVIDIKPIKDTQVIAVNRDRLIIGAGVTLSQITDHPDMCMLFPLLQAAVNEIADRTARNKITLGGNICGQILYREAVLPLLVSDSFVRIAGPKGVNEVQINRIFQEKMQLAPGEFVLQTVTEKIPRQAPYVHIKRRKMGQVGYPIVSASALRLNGSIRVALSGVLPFPFRSKTIETILNRKQDDENSRIRAAMDSIPVDQVLDDYEASRDYRLFVLSRALRDILRELGG